MVVLVDERPEEVTDMQRSVKGEVIASTFDRPADDHTTVAGAGHRGQAPVELGHDVVVLLDSMTRLGRAYNLAPARAASSPAVSTGGALPAEAVLRRGAQHRERRARSRSLPPPPVETGSRMDEVIFEEFKGTGNMELLDRKPRTSASSPP